jgi:PmbA protein
MNKLLFNPDLKPIVADALTMAMHNGATAVEVTASIHLGLSCLVRLGEVETIEFNNSKHIGITIYYNHSKGITSSSDLDIKTVQQLVATAGKIAKYTEEDPYNGLADPKYMAHNILDLNLYYPIEVQLDSVIKLAKNCEHVAISSDKRINNSEGAAFSAELSYGVYGNSNGFLAGYPSSSYALSCTVIGQDHKHKNMQRDFDYTVARNINDLNHYQLVGTEAAKRTVARLGARKLTTCKAPVLFCPNVARNLLGAFIAAISGGNLYRKSSFLLDSLHKKVFADFINLKEEPLLPKALGSAPFDGEGVITAPKYIVKNGILQSYILNSYSARKLGMETTGNAGGIHNLILNPGTGNSNHNDLLIQMGTGLVVVELIGHGINIINGDYSNGCVGFWVENGTIQYPIEETTIAGNLKDMFLNILAVGNDLDYRSNIITGSVLVAEMTISGN